MSTAGANPDNNTSVLTHDSEQWQVYATNGTPLVGVGVASMNEHDSHISVGLALVWLWRHNVNNSFDVCLQKRAMTKNRWPGMYSTSAGGHINLGESPQEAALRECNEEIGIDLDSNQLCFAGAFRVPNELQNIRFVYSYEVAGDISFHFNDGEVEAMEWMSIEECITELNKPDCNIVMKQYGEAYISLMIDNLRHQAGLEPAVRDIA